MPTLEVKLKVPNDSWLCKPGYGLTGPESLMVASFSYRGYPVRAVLGLIRNELPSTIWFEIEESAALQFRLEEPVGRVKPKSCE